MLRILRVGRTAALPDDASSHERSVISAQEWRRPGVRIAHWIVFGLLALGTVATIGPLFWMVSSALKPSREIFRTPPAIWPSAPEWSNFVSAWNQLNALRYLGNTAVLTIGAIGLQLVVSATAAYSLSKLRPKFGAILQFFFLSTLMVPAVAYLIPEYLTVAHLPILGFSLIDNWWAIWLPEAANAFNIIILKSFFDSVPGELSDAAKIDGASALQVFFYIILPNSLPALAVVSLFTVFATWKDFLWPLLVLTNPDSQPITVALYLRGMAQNSDQPLNVLLAAFVIAAVPPLLLFLVFQRQIIRGVSTTGLKG